MRGRFSRGHFSSAVAVLLLLAGAAAGQQVNVATPLRGVSDSFYEQFGIGFGLRGKGFFFNNIRPPLAPPFGGGGANADATLGFGFGGTGTSGFFSLRAGQGASRSMVSQTPSVTMMNGAAGGIADVSLSPFVIGFVPVVGGHIGPDMRPPLAPPTVNPWKLKLSLGQTLKPPAGEQPSLRAGGRQALAAGGNGAKRLGPAAAGNPWAARLAAAAAEDANALVAGPGVEQPQQAPLELEAGGLYERGKAAEAAGKLNVARIYYKMTARRASGELRDQALAALRRLDASP